MGVILFCFTYILDKKSFEREIIFPKHVFYMGDDGLTVNKYLTVDSIRDASDHSPVLVTVEISQGHRLACYP